MDEIQRFAEIKGKIDKVSESKIRLEERFKNEREKLDILIKEIQAKGYDPTKLAETKNTKAQELKKIMDEIEIEVNNIVKKLSEIEEATNA